MALVNRSREPFSDETAELVMGEGSAEMNPQFRRLLIKPEAESVPRHGVRVENVSPINKHDITIQPWWKRIDCSDAGFIMVRESAKRRFAAAKTSMWSAAAIPPARP